MNLPFQVGFFVYQYAKLRMLQFYYDFFDKYLDRADFQMCEMDTDRKSSETRIKSWIRTRCKPLVSPYRHRRA